MQKPIHLFITSIHDPGGITRRGAIANLDEVVTITNESPAAIYKATEDRYQDLLGKLRPIISKEKLSKEDWAAFGGHIVEFQHNLKNFSPEYGLEVVNLPQAVAEDLGRDVNTIEAYMIYAGARRSQPNLPEGAPDEVIMGTLRTAGRPLTPRQISTVSGVNYNTVRRAVQELLRDGKISRAEGRGRYTTR